MNLEGLGDFSNSPVVKTSLFNAERVGLIPEGQTKDASQPKHQNIKQKQYCNKSNKDFPNGPHQKQTLKEKEGFAPYFYNLLQTTLENKYSVVHGVRRVISRLEMLLIP